MRMMNWATWNEEVLVGEIYCRGFGVSWLMKTSRGISRKFIANNRKIKKIVQFLPSILISNQLMLWILPFAELLEASTYFVRNFLTFSTNNKAFKVFRFNTFLNLSSDSTRYGECLMWESMNKEWDESEAVVVIVGDVKVLSGKNIESLFLTYDFIDDKEFLTTRTFLNISKASTQLLISRLVFHSIKVFSFF